MDIFLSYHLRTIEARLARTACAIAECFDQVLLEVFFGFLRRGLFRFVPAFQFLSQVSLDLILLGQKPRRFSPGQTRLWQGKAWMPECSPAIKPVPIGTIPASFWTLSKKSWIVKGEFPLLRVDKSGRGSSATRPNRDDSGFTQTLSKESRIGKGTGTMRQMKLSHSGQNLIEYAIVVAVVVSAMLAMSTYVFRSVQSTQQTIQQEFADQ